MRNPNFLVLDEPTNDLDIVTLQILEDYLAKFHGCLIVVSHDRYFMDKVVDHILVFHGDGDIQDFPGGYSLYRESKVLSSQTSADSDKKTKDVPSAKMQKNSSNTQQCRKLTFKEKREYEQLSIDIDNLEAEKKLMEKELSSGNISTDRIIQYSKRLPVLEGELDVKSMRWLELSEIES